MNTTQFPGVVTLSGEEAGKVRRALELFSTGVERHRHASTPDDMDRCADCGLDIRNIIHFRAGEDWRSDRILARTALSLLPHAEPTTKGKM